MISPRPSSCAGLEVEAANLRLIKSMADRLAHEIGNALVPLATHQQLLAEKYKDKEFRESLDQVLADGVKRITRLINQMRFLAREGHIQPEAFAVGKLIEEAYQEARKHQPADAARLLFENGGEPIMVTGDRAALKHALAEIMLNALQANPKEPKIGVQLHTDSNGGEGGPVPSKSKFRTTAPVSLPKPRKSARAILHHAQRRFGLGIDRQPENHRDAPRQVGNCSATSRSARSHPRFIAGGLRHFLRSVNNSSQPAVRKIKARQMMSNWSF